MATKAIGILNLHRCSQLGGLTKTRSVASTSFLGRYSFMDFALSNFSNSDIDNIAILVKEHIRSIIQHVATGAEWTENSKLGGLTLLYDEPHAMSPIYNHDINNLQENSWYLKSKEADVLVFAPAHIIYKLDFRPLIEEHVKKNKRITIVYSHVNNAKTSFIGEDRCIFDSEGKLRNIELNLGADNEADIFLQTVIIDKELLRGFMHYGQKTSSVYDLRDVLRMLAKSIDVNTYRYEGKVLCFSSLQDYLINSLAFLDPELQRYFFSKDWPIYTKTYDTPPVHFNMQGQAINSIISNGCQIKGTVRNSILARGVIVEAGAVVENSIILSDTYVSEYTHLDHVVCDKESRIIHCKEIIGNDRDVQFIKRGDII